MVRDSRYVTNTAYSGAESLVISRFRCTTQERPLILIGSAIVGLVLLAVAGFYGYWRWIETQIDQEIQEIHEKVRQGDGQVGNAGEVRTELSKAEKALNMDKHRQAKKSLDRIEELLDR